MLMRKLIIVGGSNGLGLAILNNLKLSYEQVVVFDISEPYIKFENVKYIKIDLSKDIKECFDEISDADALIITAGIGVVKPFENCSDMEIKKIFQVNTVSAVRLIKSFYESLLSTNAKKCMIISSIAGSVCSPLFATYGASKAAISMLCESINIELEMAGSSNRITCINSVSFEGTSFNGGKTDISKVDEVAKECIKAMEAQETVHFINHELCNDIIGRYNENKLLFGVSSYKYKISNKRISDKSICTIGYLSGTFDLFHIGHLNLLRRAKEQCDYLIVSVHDSGAWKGKETFIPYEERKAIVESIKYVDQVVEDFIEDSDAWFKYHYDKLFVGSDYKGTERFNRYEKVLAGKAEIVYFPYTQGTSSTQLREALIYRQKQSKGE